MGNTKVGGVYVVQATNGQNTEYWAAATPMAEAVDAVRAMLPPGWTPALIKDKRLTLEQASALRLKGYGVEKLKYRP